MSPSKFTRRQFVAASATASIAPAAMTGSTKANPRAFLKPAILDGDPIRQGKSWPAWPHVDEQVLSSIEEATKSRVWCRIQNQRDGTVVRLEKVFAELVGAEYCVATGSGTQALHTSVEALGIGAGDEIITSPYTDPGTISAILCARALPVLADLDPGAFQLDPADVERKINERTKAIMPVHMMGQACDIRRVMQIAERHGLKVIEDACEAHLGMVDGKCLGVIGDLGCFSFQSSKTIACGEGGAIVGNDPDLLEQCYTVHNHGTSRRGRTEVAGPKYRMNEFEAAILLGQWPGILERHERRNQNAEHLTARLADFPGVTTQKLYEGTESGGYYVYAMTYHEDYFDGLTRSAFLRAVSAEGIPLGTYLSNGLHKEPWVDYVLNSKAYTALFPEERLERYREEIQCPECDKACGELIRFWGSGVLLATKEDMDDIADAILKVYENRNALMT